MPHRSLLISTYTLTLVACFICGRIELLNRKAGGLLPRHEYFNGNPDEGLVTWRYSLLTSQERWLPTLGPKDEHGAPVNRPLTAGEQEQMWRDIGRAKSTNALHSFVRSAGLLQYLLAPLTFLMGTALIARRRDISISVVPAFLPIVAALFCGLMMIYRGYLESLGM